jgi:hypothetical protein
MLLAARRSAGATSSSVESFLPCPTSSANVPVPEIAPSVRVPAARPTTRTGARRRQQWSSTSSAPATRRSSNASCWAPAPSASPSARRCLREADRVALRDFWEQHYGPYGAFYYNAPNDDGQGTTQYTCRFANEPLSWEWSPIGPARWA